MRIAMIGVIAMLCSPIFSQEKKAEAPLPVSSKFAKLPKLPPIPKLKAQRPDAPPPPDVNAPPPPPPAPPRHFDVVLPLVVANVPWGASDFQLPPGQISVTWVAVGPGNADVSSGIDVTVLSPQLFFKPTSSGAARLIIPPPGANVRILAQRKAFAGGFQVRASIDLISAQ